MGIFRDIKVSWLAWLNGTPPMSDAVLETIHEEFHILLYASGVFINAKYWILNVFVVLFYFFTCFSYLFFLAGTAVRQMDEFITASQTIHMAVLDILAITILVFLNLHRQDLIEVFRAMSVNFYDYGDGFEIPEMEEEFRKARRQKLIILAAVPSYLAMTALCCMMGSNIDAMFGRVEEEEYVNEVYTRTPVPIWYPIKPQGFVMHYFLVFTQILGANTLAFCVAGADAVLLFLSQSFTLQYKILIYRLRKIEDCAYHLHRTNGGQELKADQMYENSSFMECYYTCLKKSVQHHNIMIENFSRLRAAMLWITGLAVLCGSIIIAMSLLAIVLGGGKPSILSLAAMLIIAEILNMAMICSQSENLKESGASLHEVLYGLNWPDTNAKTKRTLMVIIERSKRPTVLIAGLTTLSWETFSTIMNSAYTYVNLLVATVGK